MQRKIRVLVADDQESTRQGVKALLALSSDIEVTQEASNGREAIELVAEAQPDVVLMDVRMPVMEGVEATQQIKESWPQVKVIILTMYSSHRAEALAAGADLFVVKGATGASLTDAIRSLTGDTDESLSDIIRSSLN